MLLNYVYFLSLCYANLAHLNSCLFSGLNKSKEVKGQTTKGLKGQQWSQLPGTATYYLPDHLCDSAASPLTWDSNTSLTRML